MKLAEILKSYRFLSGDMSSPPGASYGMFDMPGPCGERLKIVSSGTDGTPWEHVSVSTRRRIPNWIEMCFVKKLFWAPDDCVVQFHPPESDYVNNHPFVLHLWRWIGGDFPQPPAWTVGIKELGELPLK